MESDKQCLRSELGNRPSVTQPTELQSGTPNEFHLPAALLAKIVSLVAAEGTEGLGAWIRAGKAGRDAVYSPETLSQVRLDKCTDYAWFSYPISYYYTFFNNCLEHNNPHALFIESLRRGFAAGDVGGALAIVGDIKDIHPVATLAYLIMSDCAGIDRFDEYRKFRKQYWRTSDIRGLGDELISHIVAIGPRRRRTYAYTWNHAIFPECSDFHRYSRHWNHERCDECVYWYLSQAVLDLS